MTPEQIAKLIDGSGISIEQATFAISLGVKMLISELRGFYERNSKTSVMSADTKMLLDIMERQQQLIDYLLERDRQREGDHR